MRAIALRETIRAYLIAIGFWYGIAFLMGLQYQYRPQNTPLTWASLLELAVQASFRAFALALWTPPIFYLVGKYLPYSKSRVRYVVLWGLGAAPFVLLHTVIAWAVIPNVDDTTQQVLPRNFQYWVDIVRTSFAEDILVFIAIVVAAHGYEYLKRVRRQEAEKYEYQQALAASELQMLKMQLQPHFLFNTLHGIATLVDTEPEIARAMIVKLSNLLRTALDRDSADLIPLESELKFVRDYLDLEQVRFGSRLKIEWRIAADTRALLLPQMILQPLVENAIRHGIAPSRESGWMEITADANNGHFEIQVQNTTTGTATNGTGVGLRNVESRLKYLYGAGASLRLTFGDGNLATATLSVPALKSRLADKNEAHVVAVTEHN